MTIPQPSTSVALAAPDRNGLRRAHQALVSQIVRAFATRAQRLRQRRDWIATRDAIGALDAATLRDLGLHRSEIDSVAAEAHGIAQATRQRVLEARADTRLA